MLVSLRQARETGWRSRRRKPATRSVSGPELVVSGLALRISGREWDWLVVGRKLEIRQCGDGYQIFAHSFGEEAALEEVGVSRRWIFPTLREAKQAVGATQDGPVRLRRPPRKYDVTGTRYEVGRIAHGGRWTILLDRSRVPLGDRESWPTRIAACEALAAAIADETAPAYRVVGGPSSTLL